MDQNSIQQLVTKYHLVIILNGDAQQFGIQGTPVTLWREDIFNNARWKVTTHQGHGVALTDKLHLVPGMVIPTMPHFGPENDMGRKKAWILDRYAEVMHLLPTEPEEEEDPEEELEEEELEEELD